MQVAIPTRNHVPPDIKGALSHYFAQHFAEEEAMTEAEDRILAALRENYATRGDIAEIKQKLARLDDNGTPGISTRLALLEDNSSTMRRLRFHVATAAITVVIGLAITWGYTRAIATPIAKETAADNAKVDDLARKVDELLKRTPVSTPVTTQSVPQTVQRRGPHSTTPVIKVPKGHSMLREGEMITTRDVEPSIIGFNHLPPFGIRIPE